MITLTFLSSNSILSRIIRWFTKSQISHCAIGLEMYNVPIFLHATIGGVKITPRNKIGDYVVAEYQILIDVSNEIPTALQHIGDKYDYPGLIGYLPVMIGRWLKTKWKNPFSSSKKEVCSELILCLDPENKILEWHDLDRKNVTPEDLYEICLNGISFKKI